jgi:hypothetical protein
MSLSIIMIESIIKLTPVSYLNAIFEFKAAIEKIISVWKLRKPEMQRINAYLPAVETTMESMLLMSLWVSSQVGAITKPLPKPNSRKALPPSETLKPSVAELKIPVIETMRRLRKEMREAGEEVTKEAGQPVDAEDEQFTFNRDGFWPRGLRASNSV